MADRNQTTSSVGAINGVGSGRTMPPPTQGVEADIPGGNQWLPFMKGHNQAVRQSALNLQQHQNTVAQMALQQGYNLENMALQNQYQIEAEKRAQEWNDIGAQVDRARAAGISALAAIGSGGAGGHMSTSSSPSSSTPQAPGAVAGAADGGMSFGDFLRSAAGIALQIAGFKTDLGVKHAQAFNLRQQGYEAMSQTVGNYIDNVFKPFLLSAKVHKDTAEAISAKCNAIIQSYWINGTAEDGSPLYQQKVKTELRQAIADAGLTEANQDVAEGNLFNLITSGIKNLTEANDLDLTRPSRIASNEAGARKDAAAAYGMELSNRDYEYYGIDKNTDFMGVPLLPVVRWFEDLERSMKYQEPKGLGRLLSSLVTGFGKRVFNDVKSVTDFIQTIWKEQFNTHLPEKDAEDLANIVVPAVNGKHYGARHGVHISTR